MSPVVGIDPSLTCTALYSDTGPHLIRSKHKGPQRLNEIANRLIDQLADDSQIFLEGYSFGRQSKAQIYMGELGGVLRLTLWQAGVPYIEVPPSTLKKFVTGKGNANKDLMVSSVSARTQQVFDSNDTVDAFALYCLGRQVAGLDHPLAPLPKVNLSALDKLEMP